MFRSLTACFLLGVTLSPVSADIYVPPENGTSSLVGQSFILSHVAGPAKIKIKKSQLNNLSGTCDLAVSITAVDRKPKALNLDVTYIGVPIPKNRTTPLCLASESQAEIEIRGFDANDSISNDLHQLLQTPEEYLSASGIKFDYATSPATEKAAQRSSSTQPPTMVLHVDGAYTQQARADHLTGAVLLAMVVGSDGRAKNARVLRSLGDGLDERAVQVLQLWRFQPAIQNGHPIATDATLEMNLVLL